MPLAEVTTSLLVPASLRPPQSEADRPEQQGQPGGVGRAVAAHARQEQIRQCLHRIAAEQRDDAEIAERQRHREGKPGGERALSDGQSTRRSRCPTRNAELCAQLFVAFACRVIGGAHGADGKGHRITR